MHNVCIDCGQDISKRARKCRRCSKLGHRWPEGYYERQSKAQKKRFKNNPQWNEGKHWEHLQGENNGQWKGDKVHIKTLHRWVKYHKGKPMKCEFCRDETRKVYDWANKSHKYLRDLNDWLRLCRSCHRKYDYAYRKLGTLQSFMKKNLKELENNLRTWKRYRGIWWPRWLVYHEPCWRKKRWKLSECLVCLHFLGYREGLN